MMKNYNTTDLELAWAAGFFDGEGTCGRYPRKNRPGLYVQMALSQIDRTVLDRFNKAIGVGAVTGPYNNKNPNAQPQWAWQVGTNNKCQMVADRLWAYLSPVKQQQLKVAGLEPNNEEAL